MQRCLIFLLYLLSFTFCKSQITNEVTDGISTIPSAPIRRPRGSGSSGRLSLINYRFNRRPKKKHMDVTELKLILGSEFDSQYMSIDKPKEMTNQDMGAIYVVRQDSWRYEDMVRELQNSNLTQELQKLAGDEFELGSEYVKTFEKWLLKRASCPVKYVWEDIGGMFWPRYVRRGDCSTDIGTCSWPSGMHCVPSETSNITILRWHCKTRQDKGKGRRRGFKSPANKDYKEEEKPLHLKCSWIKVPYPITTECMCTC